MSKNNLFRIGLIVAVLLIGSGWIYASKEDSKSEPTRDLNEGPLAGYMAPGFLLEDLTGQKVDLVSLRGRPVVLNFWATWCPPCRAEMPDFERASRRYAGQVAVLGIDQGEARGDVAAFGRTLGISYPLLIDEGSTASRAYDVHLLPTTFFIDADGVIQEVYSGILNEAILDDRISGLLNG